VSLRFQADACLDAGIGRGLRRREPAIDFRDASSVILDGTPDPEVLEAAADDGRVLVTSDVKTMLVHFANFVDRRDSPGVILVPSSRSIGETIEGLLVVWLTLTSADMKNQARWLPNPR
jgi:predicted nuclease of predicted toxin-antitoxin system